MTDLIDRAELIGALARNPFVGSKVFAIVRALPAAEDIEAYQRGYEDGFREGRTRRKMSEEQDEALHT